MNSVKSGEMAELLAARSETALNPRLVEDLEHVDDAYRQGWRDGAYQALRWVLGEGDEIEDASLDT
jgi:hypothetical protein